MPNTKNIKLQIGGQNVEVEDIQALNLALDYILEDPEAFENKGSSTAFDLTVPATLANDQIFNTFHNPNIDDLTSDDYFTGPRSCNIEINGVNIFNGWAYLNNATHTNRPEQYSFDLYGANGNWLTEMQGLTLWDCLNTQAHTFDQATIEASWTNFNTDEFHDYVYAPVRYRQPFGSINTGSLTNTIPPDSAITIYDLRPSISVYWLLYRAFRLFGYQVKSDFFNTTMFRGLVLPWTWGDFFDINSQLTQALQFKAAGAPPSYPPAGENGLLWNDGGTPNQTVYAPAYTTGITSYVFSGPWTAGGVTNQENFVMDRNYPPYGYDTQNNYSFDNVTGTMKWVFNPPPYLSSKIGGNLTANFELQLLAQLHADAGAQIDLFLEVTHQDAGGTTIDFNSYEFMTVIHGTLGSGLTPTVFDFQVTNLNPGDTVSMQLKFNAHNSSTSITIFQSQYLNQNYIANANGSYANVNTTPSWELIQSSIALTSFEITAGSQVHFQWYDKFRSYNFLDLLRGLIDCFDLSIQTDSVNKVIYIEPTYPCTVPNCTATPDVLKGFFTTDQLDWNNKIDVSRTAQLSLYSDCERQFDFQFKQDGSDGGLNIYSGRYKGLYLANGNLNYSLNYSGTGISDGMSAVVPGAARYLFPERFQIGAKTRTNRFFSTCVHYKAVQWSNISSLGAAPQFIALIPENVSNSSAADVSQSFEPKLAFYKGYVDKDLYGGWAWLGDPAVNTAPDTTKNLPFMFSVNYGLNGHIDPILTYCDQKVGGSFVPGLLKTFFINRLAVMRNGKKYQPYCHLNLNDICNWLHREAIRIDGGFYYLIGINKFHPTLDESTQCTFWKYYRPTTEDTNSIFPSQSSVMTNPASLAQYDLKYAQLLLFTTDLPTI